MLFEKFISACSICLSCLMCHQHFRYYHKSKIWDYVCCIINIFIFKGANIRKYFQILHFSLLSLSLSFPLQCTEYLYFFLQLFCIILMLFNRKRGRHTSGILFLFWLVLTICETIQYRSAFIQIQTEVRKHIKLHVHKKIFFEMCLIWMEWNIRND